jgi:hypothetical protein
LIHFGRCIAPDIASRRRQTSSRTDGLSAAGNFAEELLGLRGGKPGRRRRDDRAEAVVEPDRSRRVCALRLDGDLAGVGRVELQLAQTVDRRLL